MKPNNISPRTPRANLRLALAAMLALAFVLPASAWAQKADAKGQSKAAAQARAAARQYT
ncbi:MAG: hypothetical protein H7Z38_13860, partial [Rubrivivax sp.]|nr:hypothetical protein [Pyrinomonadaceae bacterium]